MKKEKNQSGFSMQFRHFAGALRQVEGNKFIFWLVMIVNCIADAVLFLSFPIITKLVIDAVSGEDYSLFIKTILITLLLLSCCFSLFALSAYIFHKIGLRTKRTLRFKLFEHYLKLPISFLERTHTGDLLTRSSMDLDMLSECFGVPLRVFIFQLIRGTGAILVMLVLDYRLSLILIGIAAFSFLFTRQVLKKISLLTERLRTQNSRIVESILTVYEGFLTIKTLGLSEYLNKSVKAQNDKYTSLALGINRRQALINIFNETMSWLNFSGVIIAGALLYTRGLIEISNVVAILYLRGYFNNMLETLGQSLTAFQNYIAGAKRVFDVLNVPEEKISYPCTGRMPGHSGIVLDNIAFAYEDGEDIFRDLTVHFEEKRLNAIVGPSGSGKSTLLKLLLAYYLPASGNIFYFNRELGAWTLPGLRDLFSYVPQQCLLYAGTVLDNIKYGNPDVSLDTVISITRQLKLHDCIVGLKKGYDTPVSDMGLNFSGGQIQRLTLARALVKKAEIVLFDEPTSALDSNNENLIMDMIMKYCSDKTVIVVAHRLSTILNADKIFVLDNGRICEAGNHSELLARNGVYTRLYNSGFDD